MGGRKKGKKEASCQSAEPLKCLDWHRDLWVFSRLFRWVQPCLQSMAPGLHLLFCPNLGKRGSSHWPLCPSYDPAHCGFFYLSPGSRLPTGPFSTFISALWGTWALLLSLCTLQSSWETRDIHQLTTELFTYLPSYCCCVNLCHLMMAMNKASSSMPRECAPNDSVFEMSFFYPEVSHCLLRLRFDIKRDQGSESLCFWSFHFYSIPLSSGSPLIWKKQILSYHFIYVVFSLYPMQKFMLVQFSHSVMSDSLQPHGLQHTRLPCPSPTPGAYSNSCPSSLWCHPTISSSVVPFSSTCNLSQHQGLFQWVSSLHQVAKVLELQLQHQSFQWICTTGFL